MKSTLGAAILLSLMAATVWACTVQTEDDSVPGDGHGWGGLYYYYTPFTGYLVEGKHEDFAQSDDSIVNHYLVAEGVVGFLKDFYAKVDLPYSYTQSKLSAVPEGQTGMVTEEETTNGIGDAQVTFKWDFLNAEEGSRAGILAGVQLPTGDEAKELGSGLYSPKIHVVAGTPAGPGRLYAGLGYTLNPEKDSFDAGDVVNYTLTYDCQLGSGVTIPLEVIGNLQMKDKSDGQEVAESGSHVLVVSPGVTYTPVMWATLCVGVIVPVLKQGYTADYDFQPNFTFFYNF
jgi:hypothetical protein